MKKWIACLLAVCLLLNCAPAWAATPITDYTLEEKWDLQMEGSGFKGQITFDLEGEAAFGADAATWQALSMLLPQLTVDVQSAPRGDNRETNVQIVQEGTQVGSAQILTDGVQYALKSDLINANDVYYAFPKDFDWSFLMLEEGENWPSIYPMLFSMMTADEEWSERVNDLAAPYTTKLALWMQGYMDVTAETEENGALTRMYCQIPAEAVKVQMKQMMVDFYRDEALLSALREVFTAREAAAYLDGSMQDTFFTMLDLLHLEGDVVIDRLYDAQGNALLDSISLPFAATEKVKQLTIAITPDGEGKAHTLSGMFQDGRTFVVAMNARDEGVVTGSVQMEVVPKAEFTVEAEAAQTTEAEDAVQLMSFQFNLARDVGEETYDLASDLCAHVQEMTLVITPDEQDTTGMHDVSLHVRSEMTSKSSRRAATYIDTVASLTDQTLGSSVTVSLKCNTASPWTPMTLAEITQTPMQLHALEDTVLSALKNQWETRFEQWLMEWMLEGFVQGKN